MALLDSYSQCPCGSGEKYKWCCQKAESYVERGARLEQGGQTEAALKLLDEGLRAVPDNPWLGLRKASILIERRDVRGAAALVRDLAAKHPGHATIQGLHVQLMLDTDKISSAAGAFQSALANVPKDRRAPLGRAALLLGAEMLRRDAVAAGLAHLHLVPDLDPELARTAAQGIAEIESNPQHSLWVRAPLMLSPVPAGLDDARTTRFQAALDLASAGRWAEAAREFDALSKAGTPESDRNLGLCRLWLADHAGAVDALRRYTSWIGPNPSTLSLEILCQTIEPLRHDETVEQLQWIWSLRDRAGLLERLEREKRAVAMGKRPLNPAVQDSPQVDCYAVLDKPSLESAADLTVDRLPRVEGTLLVGLDLAILEAFDDGRLDRLADWFRAVAGETIPPAHPRTKSISRAPRHHVGLRSEWILPRDADPVASRLVIEEAHAAQLLKLWPNTPLPALGGRTPLQAAHDQELALPLRAALLEIEVAETESRRLDSAPLALREAIGLPPEPAPAAESVAIETLHPAELARIDLSRLDDQRLAMAFLWARRFGMAATAERSALELAKRPNVWTNQDILACHYLYTSLAGIASSREQYTEALAWLDAGRKAEPADQLAASSIYYDTHEVMIRAEHQEPEQWVPALSNLLQRTRDGAQSAEPILRMLVALGLVRPVQDPENPGEVFFDSRPLEELLSRYGPRISDAEGRVGVSAARPGVWTPGADAGSETPGGIWTPGSSGGSSERGPSKLIIPGA